MTTTLPPNTQPLPLDAAGLLGEDAFDALATAPSTLVFAQQPDARIDVAGWQRHAKQFFGADLSLSRPKRYGPVPPRIDGAHVLLAPPHAPSIFRTILLRPRTDADLRAAERAEGGGGLALLAKRCAMVVLVLVDATDDRGSLLLAALLSSVLLGPVMPPGRERIIGARSARQEVEERAS